MQVVESDARLVARCRAGDDDAWRELVERFSRYVYAIAVQAYRLPASDAEDVFQEVFARAYENLSKLRDDNAIRPWLAQLTRRLCLDTLRASSREQPEEFVEPSGHRRHDRQARRGARRPRGAGAAARRTAARSSTASSPATRAIATIGEALDLPPRHHRQPDLPLPREAPQRARGKKSGLRGVWMVDGP